VIVEVNSEPWNEARPFGTVTLLFETEAERAQASVLIEALEVYAERNKKYNDNWRRMGWRGQLIRVRERAERLWDYLWDGAPRDASDIALPHAPYDVDDALDLINFAGFLVRAVRDGNRDGTWWSQ
jgi:hypothetical protein